MASVEPTRETVWDYHPDLLAVQVAFDQMVTSRQGGVVLIAGGPASGRTGLARALAVRLRAHPAHPMVVAGGFRGDQWEPWVSPDRARSVASLKPGMDLAASVLELGGILGLPGAGAVAKLLGQLAGASSAAWTLLSRHAEAAQPLPSGSGPDLVREVLRVAAGSQLVVGWQPVVSVLDDLDRAPTAQDWWRGLVVRLAGELGDLPLLLVVTLDGPVELGGHELGEPAGLWAARRLVEAGVGRWVPVGRLDQAAVAAWLGPCEPTLAERLWEVTGGEPRWLGELWEHWRTTRTVRRDLSGHWVLGVPDHTALGKVHDLVWERLERCYGVPLDTYQSERVMRTLAVGALEGREFTAQAVAVVVGRDPDELIDEFDDYLLVGDQRPDGLLQEAGFIELGNDHAGPNSDEGTGRALCRYRFASDLHWRTLRRYGLAGREHQDGCRGLAAALEWVLQPEPERAAATIASLWLEAGDPDAAAHWQRLAEYGAALETVEASARVLLAYDTAGWDRFEHAQAALELEYATFRIMKLSQNRPWEMVVRLVLEVAEGWARAAAAAGWPHQHARALHTCGSLHDLLKEHDAAISCYQRARRVAAAAGDPEQVIWAMVTRSKVEFDHGQARVARRRAAAARRIAHQYVPNLEVLALDHLAGFAQRVGDWEEALAAAASGVTLADRPGSKQWQLPSLLRTLSTAQENLGRVGEARETAGRALVAARQAANRDAEGWAEVQLGRLWAADPQVAEAHLLRGLAIASERDDPAMEAACRVELAGLARGQGDLRAARAELGQATRITHTLGRADSTGNVWQGWALLAQAEGLPGRQVALLWALAAVHIDEVRTAPTAALWQAAEQAAADAAPRSRREDLAASATAALAQNGGWALLAEVFGSLDADSAGDSDSPSDSPGMA